MTSDDLATTVAAHERRQELGVESDLFAIYMMRLDLSSFNERLAALKDLASGLSNLRESDKHLIGLYQADLLAAIDEATSAGCPRSEVLAAARGITQLLIQLAERDNLPVSHEIDRLIRKYAGTQPPIARTQALPRSKPLAAFAKEPAVVHTVFVDEAGTGSFTEAAQPVLSLIGVVVEDRRIEEFERQTRALLARYGVADDAEIHAQDVLAAVPPFDTLADRDSLLMEFLKPGLNHAMDARERPACDHSGDQAKRAFGRLRLHPLGTIQRGRCGAKALATR